MTDELQPETGDATGTTSDRHGDGQDAGDGAQTADAPTLTALRERASELGIEGRSKMSRDELEDAVAQAEATLVVQNVRGEGQVHAAALAASPDPDVDAGIQPGTPAEVGRPNLADLAATRAAARNPRVIG